MCELIRINSHAVCKLLHWNDQAHKASAATAGEQWCDMAEHAITTTTQALPAASHLIEGLQVLDLGLLLQLLARCVGSCAPCGRGKDNHCSPARPQLRQQARTAVPRNAEGADGARAAWSRWLGHCTACGSCPLSYYVHGCRGASHGIDRYISMHKQGHDFSWSMQKTSCRGEQWSIHFGCHTHSTLTVLCSVS